MAEGVSLLLDDLDFAEAPRWRGGTLWFSDFYKQRVFRVDLRGNAREVAYVPNQPSGLGWLPDGRLLMVSMLDRRIMRLEADRLVLHADISGIADGWANDMVVDRRGNAYVTNTGPDVEGGHGTTRLALVRPDGSTEAVADGLMAPNGCVVTEDGETLVVAETMGARLTAFRIGSDGRLGPAWTWAHLPGMHPDGLSLDAEGAIWFGDPMNRCFVRVRAGGQITDRLPTAKRAIACMLGGDDGRTLFLITADTFMPDEARGSGSSCIVTCRVEIPHAGLP